MTKSAPTEEFRQGFRGHAIKMGIWTHKNCSPARLMVVIVAVIVLLASHANTALALEFKSQAEKIAWIKNAIKGKKFEPDYKEADDKYYKGGYYTAEEKQFMREFLKDLLAQTNIEYIEPIATGDSVDDPAIAKFNTSCPNKKPMNVGLKFASWLYSHPYEMTDEMLEVARERAPSRSSYKCKSHFIPIQPEDTCFMF